jgi:hypothetical protein
VDAKLSSRANEQKECGQKARVASIANSSFLTPKLAKNVPRVAIALPPPPLTPFQIALNRLLDSIPLD